MTIGELRERLELFDGEAEVIIAIKQDRHYNAYDISADKIGVDPYFEDNDEKPMPFTIWIQDEDMR